MLKTLLKQRGKAIIAIFYALLLVGAYTSWFNVIPTFAITETSGVVSVTCPVDYLITGTANDFTCTETNGNTVNWTMSTTASCLATSSFANLTSSFQPNIQNCPNPWSITITAVYLSDTVVLNIPVLDASLVLTNGLCNSIYDGQSLSSTPVIWSLCTAGTESSLSGSAPWAWSCDGTNGGTPAYCSADSTTANAISVTCSPNPVITGVATNVTCSEDNWYTVLWSSNNGDNCTTTSAFYNTGQQFIGDAVTGVNFSCPSAREVDVYGTAGPETASTKLIVSDSSTTTTTCTSATPNACNSQNTCEDVSVNWFWCPTLSSTTTYVNNCEAVQGSCTVSTSTQLAITCTNSVVVWGSITCSENNDVAVAWSFVDSAGTSQTCTTSTEVVDKTCVTNTNAASGILTVTAVKSGYSSVSAETNITAKTLSDLVITCDSDKKTGKPFSCAATCVWSADPVNWNSTECTTGPATTTSCTFNTSGGQTITAAPSATDSDCKSTNLSISVGDAEAAKITCTGPYYINEPFVCSVQCEEQDVMATWSISAAGTSNCWPTSGTSTSCTTDSAAIVSVSGADYCADISETISMSFYDLALTCSPTKINVGENFACNASGGDQNYTWFYPSTVSEGTSSTSALKNLSVSISSPADYPSNGKIIVKVQDGLNSVEEIEIEVLPPAIDVEKIYTIGNAGITIGATEDIYVQLNAIGWISDIKTIQAQLIQGSCSNLSTCSGNQVFNIVNNALKLENSTVLSTSTGSITYDLLYKIPVLTPDYSELVNGNYTYEISIYDVYNQKSVAYLQTYIGTIIDGDINWDQSIDILDIVKTVMYYLNPSEIPTQQEQNAVDFNNNQQIDLVDVIKVIQEAMKS